MPRDDATMINKSGTKFCQRRNQVVLLQTQRCTLRLPAMMFGHLFRIHANSSALFSGNVATSISTKS
eukprot:4548506-Karenia_brevis.AAC.1